MDGVAAVQQAYHAYYRSLVGQLYAVTGDLPEAQDVVHEAYARALARPGPFLEVRDPAAWLRTVALNLARSRFRRRWLFDRLVSAGRVERGADTVPAMSPDRVALVTALRKLARPTREVIVLHHLADQPIEEVAATLGVPVGTVKARLSRGRAALARHLADDPATVGASSAVSAATGSTTPTAGTATGATGAIGAAGATGAAGAAGANGSRTVTAGTAETAGPAAVGTAGSATVAAGIAEPQTAGIAEPRTAGIAEPRTAGIAGIAAPGTDGRATGRKEQLRHA